MKRSANFFRIAVVVLVLISCSLNNDVEVIFSNKTTHTIKSIHYSLNNSNDWSDNILNSELMPDSKFAFTLAPDIYNFRFYFFSVGIDPISKKDVNIIDFDEFIIEIKE